MDRLYRSRSDRMFAGVAGGLAERLEADPALVRVAWAVLVFVTGGFALLVYIIMAFVVPEGPAVARPVDHGGASYEGASGDATGRARGSGTALVVGVTLILIGGALLVERLLPAFDLGALWPVVLIAVGIVIIAASVRRSP